MLPSLPWFSRLDVTRSISQLFEHIPDVMYFAKDRERRIVMANRRFAQHCGFSAPEQLFGKTDEALFPPYMARKFRADDQTILESESALLDLVELFPTREGLPEWFITQKLPLYDTAGAVHGICGVVQNYERILDRSNDPIFALVEYIRNNYSKAISIPEMSQRIGLSQRQLERRFQQTFRLSPRQYLVRLRVLIAGEKLRSTNASITDVAIGCGFYDHSSFIRHFKATLGTTPLAYRQRRF